MDTFSSYCEQKETIGWEVFFFEENGWVQRVGARMFHFLPRYLGTPGGLFVFVFFLDTILGYSKDWSRSICWHRYRLLFALSVQRLIPSQLNALPGVWVLSNKKPPPLWWCSRRSSHKWPYRGSRAVKPYWPSNFLLLDLVKLSRVLEELQSFSSLLFGLRRQPSCQQNLRSEDSHHFNRSLTVFDDTLFKDCHDFSSLGWHSWLPSHQQSLMTLFEDRQHFSRTLAVFDDTLWRQISLQQSLMTLFKDSHLWWQCLSQKNPSQSLSGKNSKSPQSLVFCPFVSRHG